jgi:hypothetical protein
MMDAGSAFDDRGDDALLAAGGVAAGGVLASATGVGLPAGITAEGIAGALAAGGALSKGVGSVLKVGAHGVAAWATSNPSHIGPGIFSATAGALPLKLGPVASFFQDKIAGIASKMVGFESIPSACK